MLCTVESPLANKNRFHLRNLYSDLRERLTWLLMLTKPGWSFSCLDGSCCTQGLIAVRWWHSCLVGCWRERWSGKAFGVCFWKDSKAWDAFEYGTVKHRPPLRNLIVESFYCIWFSDFKNWKINSSNSRLGFNILLIV